MHFHFDKRVWQCFNLKFIIAARGDLMIFELFAKSIYFNVISFKYFLEHIHCIFLLKTLDCHPTKAESSPLLLNVVSRTALLLRTEMKILIAGKLSPLFYEVTVT